MYIQRTKNTIWTNQGHRLFLSREARQAYGGSVLQKAIILTHYLSRFTSFQPTAPYFAGYTSNTTSLYEIYICWTIPVFFLYIDINKFYTNYCKFKNYYYSSTARHWFQSYHHHLA
uniref:Uncharacterized protein n=1 Tax=Octopus bimaculoides TaxID=37653 RepID=A0A0L8FP60_OCTBM